MNHDEKLLSGLKQVVLDNLENEQFSVEHLSKLVGLSRSHLHRKLKKLKGQSTSQFIREVRLEEALKLIHQDVATTSEIAYRVGFNSPSYFHKCFLDYYGYPPSEAKGMAQIPSESKAGDNKSDHQSAVTSNVPIPPAPVSKEKVPQRSLWSRTFILSTVAVLILISAATYYWSNNNSSRPLERSIAVLPFNNLSADETNQHFADGLVEDLLSRLSTVREFKVISRTSSNAYRERGTRKIPEIAAELGVSYIVEGSVQKEGNKARITIQLIDAKNDLHIWAKPFDRDLANIFEVQTEIAMLVASELSNVLTAQQTLDIQKSQTKNVKAFELYQLGRFYWGKRKYDDYLTAIQYFEQAIIEDPNYALAYAGIADTYFLMNWEFSDINEIIKYRNKAEEYALKALEIDERLAEAHTVLATLYFFIDWDWASAEKTFLKALNLNPNYSTLHHRYAEHLSHTGRHKLARKHINIAIELDPLSYVIRRNSTKFYLNQGQFEEALTQAELSEELGDGNTTPVWYKFVINYFLGNDPATFEYLKRLQRIDNYFPEQELDSVYNSSGIEGIMRWRIEATQSSKGKAKLYAFLGENEKAMDWFEKAYYEGDRMSDVAYMYSPTNLHSNPRFIALLKKMNLPWSPESSL